MAILLSFFLLGCSDADRATKEILRSELAGYADLSVTFEQGVATLYGKVASKKDKETAMTLARNVSGVRAVNGNRLRVSRSAPVVSAKEDIPENDRTDEVKNGALLKKG